MKLSSLVIVATVALALVTTGCRYNKAGGSSSLDDAGGVSDIDTLEEGDIDALGQKGFDELYERCTDVDFKPVYFAFDSSVLPQGELSKVDAVVKHLADNAKRVLIVEGHCDERGSDEYNVMLGDRRALIIRDYMVQNGIAADRIQTKSFGEGKPFAIGFGEEFWSKNRRGEFAIYQK